MSLVCETFNYNRCFLHIKNLNLFMCISIVPISGSFMLELSKLGLHFKRTQNDRAARATANLFIYNRKGNSDRGSGPGA